MFSLLTPKQCFLDAQGNPANNHRLWTKVSGSNTNKATTRDADGAVPNTNPIILDSRGEVPFGVYGTTGPYRLILAAPGDLTDPPTSPIWGPRDGISGINDFVPSGTLAEEWNPTGLTPTFLTSTAFSVPGDQTLVFEPRRRVRATVGAGFRFGTVSSNTFNAGPVTTSVIIVNDITGTGLDGSLSAVAVGKTSATNTSQPYDSSRGLDIASAGTLTLPANADRFNITGTTTVSAIANSWVGRRVYLTHAAIQSYTPSANLVIPGTVSFATGAGDESIWEQISTAPAWKLINYMRAADRLFSSKKISTRQVFTASGTWTRPEGCIAVYYRMVGGGGGGGGNALASSTQAAAGGGGGSGGYTESLQINPAATAAVIIGAGGAGGIGTNNGANGGITSFGGSNSANGGFGGGFSTSSTASGVKGTFGPGGLPGGFTGVGVVMHGQDGGDALHHNSAFVASGRGGDSMLGAGGARLFITAASNNIGNAARGPGGGGSGSASLDGGVAATGGAGGAGLLVIDEYY